MAVGGAAVVVVGGFGVVFGLTSSHDLPLMMWTSSRAKLPSAEAELTACKII